MNKKLVIVIFAIIILSVISFFYIINPKSSDNNGYTSLTMKEFQKKINAKEDFKIYLYKTSCPACQNFKPLLDETLKEEKTQVFSINMEIKENMDASFLKNQNIKQIPILINYKNGKEIERLEGIQSKKYLKDFINKK